MKWFFFVNNLLRFSLCSSIYIRIFFSEILYEDSIHFMDTRWLLRFEFQLPHPILSPALATDKKWPLSQFHISYQNSEISWPKVPISDFQSQFSMSKIIRNFLKNFFIEEYHFRGTFFVIDIFWKIQFLKHFIY